MIDVQNVGYTYMKKTPFEKTALKNISFGISENEFVAIAGHTGSGKSTLIQIIAGLIDLTDGKVLVDGEPVNNRKVRQKIGIVFQYPEHQIFEETIEKDISFGPRNFGLDEKEIAARVDEAMRQVGLPAELKTRSPFELSGGQRRRVAIAGILALKPKYLILDEPTAGLDPRTKKNLLNEIKKLHRSGVTVIFVSHSMEDIIGLANRVLVLAQGKILFDGVPRELFCREEILKTAGLMPPAITRLVRSFRQSGIDIPPDIMTADEAENEILKLLKKGVGK